MNLEYASPISVVADGKAYNYGAPVVGTHIGCFKAIRKMKEARPANGEEVIVYACAALNPERQGVWKNNELIKFPVRNYLRFGNVLTYVPGERKYGDSKDGVFIDVDEKGEGINKRTAAPRSLIGWKETDEGLLVKDGRIFVRSEYLNKSQWNENNLILVGLSSPYFAKSLAGMANKSGRVDKPFWKVNTKGLEKITRNVPVLAEFDTAWLVLDCGLVGDSGGGCALWVPGSK